MCAYCIYAIDGNVVPRNHKQKNQTRILIEINPFEQKHKNVMVFNYIFVYSSCLYYGCAVRKIE